MQGTFSYTVLAVNAEGNATASLTIHAKATIEAPVIEAGNVMTVRGRGVDSTRRAPLNRGGGMLRMCSTTEPPMEINPRATGKTLITLAGSFSQGSLTGYN